MRHLLLTSAIAGLLSGCTALPGSGPGYSEFQQIKEEQFDPYGLQIVEITGNNAEYLGRLPAARLHTGFNTEFQDVEKVAKEGDAIEVLIWEANPESLFGTQESGPMPIAAKVSKAGKVFVPYAGYLNVADLTEAQIQSAIGDALKGTAIEPQVQVSIKDSPTHSVSIAGGVQRPGQYQIQPDLDLLDAISISGGSKAARHETRVSLLRSGVTNSVMLSDVYKSPKNNIKILPGDVLELSHAPLTFTSFGAVRKTGQISFASETLTLEQAVAKAGGLHGPSASTQNVFLFRFEESRRLHAVGEHPIIQAHPVPTIYRLDMSSPKAFFLARSFEVKSNDIIYVATAPAAELSKFISLVVSPIVGNTESINAIANE